MTKLTYQNQDQRHKYHHLMTTLHLTLKMTTAQVVETSVTNNSLSEDYSTQTITWDKQLNEDSLLDSRWLPLRLLKCQSPTTNSLSKDYPHPDDHAKHIIQNYISEIWIQRSYGKFLEEPSFLRNAGVQEGLDTLQELMELIFLFTDQNYSWFPLCCLLDCSLLWQWNDGNTQQTCTFCWPS